MLTVPVYFDFASTLCYVAHRVAGRLAPRLAELDIELAWRPLDLARLAGWRRGAAIDGERRANALRVLRELEVEARMPARWLDSRPAGALCLRLHDAASAASWRERVWSAVFEEGRDIGEPGEIGRLAADLGFDPPGEIDDGFADLKAATRAAHADGVTGVPTFMIDEWPFGGIQEDRTMLVFFERYARAKRRQASAATADDR